MSADPTRSSFANSPVGIMRDLTAFWFLGLCNDYGYVVMLSAAYDILGQFEEKNNETKGGEHTHNGTQRCCQTMSTGVILLADILPLWICKAVASSLPLWLNIRMSVAVALAGCSFVLVAFASARWMAFLGVICTSASCGIGESTLLTYSSSYDKTVASSWFSGSCGAGLFGAFSYALLIDLGVSIKYTMLIFLVVPAVQAMCFWLVLRKPRRSSIPRMSYTRHSTPEILTFMEKCAFVLNDLALKYIAPLALVYFAEYLINQGLFELIYFEDTFIDHSAQYRWFNVVYCAGAFLSRSSVSIIELKKIWSMALLQSLNAILFTVEAIYFLSPNIWFVYVIILYEGLVGGGAYINAFYMMSEDVPPQRRQLALNIVTRSDSYAIMLAGFLAIPVHNTICGTSVRRR